MNPAMIWLAIDGAGEIYGPFLTAAAVERYRLDTNMPGPLTLLEVKNGANGPVFLVAGDALCDAMDNIIFTKRAEKREKWKGRVTNWVAGS